MNKVAIITGVTGQDGSYLAEFLLSIGYRVVGIKRRTSTDVTERLSKCLESADFTLVEGDVSDLSSLLNIFYKYLPACESERLEIYNLAAQSHVKTSFDQPKLTWDVTAGGCLNCLEAIRQLGSIFEGSNKHIRFYQAGSSEMFGSSFDRDPNTHVKYQDEETTFEPQSPYAVAKLAAHQLVKNYRKAYNIFGCNGILFNHESPRRGEEFVTRKITKYIGELMGAADFHLGSSLPVLPKHFPRLKLGNLNSYRDWGHSADFCHAMWLMLQQDEPDDYVICTGETHSIREFLDVAFSHVGIKDWSSCVEIDPAFYRPSEVDYLCGSNDKAKAILGWQPEITFTGLVQEMVDYDVSQNL